MEMSSILKSSIILIVSILIGLYFIQDGSSNRTLSKPVQNWMKNGQYFKYKNDYNIFYILKNLNTDEYIQTYSSDRQLQNCKVNLFIHGYPTSSYDFIKVWNQFDRIENGECTYLLTLDLLGFGFSDKPLNYEYSIFDWADLIERLLIYLNVNKVNLISHDMGDTVAQEIIRRYNLGTKNYFIEIKSGVLLNGGIFYDTYVPRLSQNILRIKYIGNIAAKYFTNLFLFKIQFAKIFGILNSPNDNDLSDFYNIIKYNNGRQTLPLTIKYLDERAEYGEVWINALNETQIPLMFIFGPADPINPHELFVKKMRDELPNVKLIKLSQFIGHYPQWEDPFNVFQLIYKFFNVNNRISIEIDEDNFGNIS